MIMVSLAAAGGRQPCCQSVPQFRALDLFCGAGGATKGLQRAGFHVTGIDIKRESNLRIAARSCQHLVMGRPIDVSGTGGRRARSNPKSEL